MYYIFHARRHSKVRSERGSNPFAKEFKPRPWVCEWHDHTATATITGLHSHRSYIITAAYHYGLPPPVPTAAIALSGLDAALDVMRHVDGVFSW